MAGPRRPRPSSASRRRRSRSVVVIRLRSADSNASSTRSAPPTAPRSIRVRCTVVTGIAFSRVVSQRSIPVRCQTEGLRRSLVEQTKMPFGSNPSRVHSAAADGPQAHASPRARRHSLMRLPSHEGGEPETRSTPGRTLSKVPEPMRRRMADSLSPASRAWLKWKWPYWRPAMSLMRASADTSPCNSPRVRMLWRAPLFSN